TTSEATAANSSRLPAGCRTIASHKQPSPTSPRWAFSMRKPCPLGSGVLAPILTVGKPSRIASSLPGEDRAAFTLQPPVSSRSMDRHPGRNSFPGNPRQNPRISRLFTSTIFLPKYVAHHVSNRLPGIACWKTYGKSHDWEINPIHTRAFRIEQIEEEQASLRLRSYPFRAIPSDTTDIRSTGHLWQLLASRPARVSFPGFPRHLQRGIPSLLIHAQALVLRREQTSNRIPVLVGGILVGPLHTFDCQATDVMLPLPHPPSHDRYSPASQLPRKIHLFNEFSKQVTTHLSRAGMGFVSCQKLHHLLCRHIIPLSAAPAVRPPGTPLGRDRLRWPQIRDQRLESSQVLFEFFLVLMETDCLHYISAKGQI